jgi:hypothetical protein
MSYLTTYHIGSNEWMLRRVTACAAAEGMADPVQWAADNQYLWAAAPGWSDAWEYALAANPEDDPGKNEAVITDGMILAQVQALVTASMGG